MEKSFDKDQIKGLTEIEVRKREESGKVNDYEENVAKSTKDIIFDNIFTLFNFLNFGIGICLLLVGAYSNMAYLAIIFINITMGIYQEIHARNLVAKLSIISKEKACVMRDGEKKEIDTKGIVLDDVIILNAGDEIPADLEVLSGSCEVNEALLTGESDLIKKVLGDTMLSGSFIVSGQVYAKVIHVGKDNYAMKITSEAKVHKPIESELMSSIKKVSKFTSFIIIPLGVILFLEAYLIRSSGIKVSVVASAAALLGMLPKGLVLLIGIALSTAVVKLAKKRILVQNMYSVETLAHVDTLCLDKTGTITEGKMKVERVEILDEAYMDKFSKIMGSYLKATTDNNITMVAIRDHFKETTAYTPKKIKAFSSENKWGGVEFENLGTIILGAPEKLVPKEKLPQGIIKAQEKGYRVLMVGISKEGALGDELPVLEPLAIIEIDDPVREKANETLEYLHREGIDLKVISGDNPITVSNVARRAGLKGYEKYIDLSAVKTEEEVRDVVKKYTIFGRVSPKQKQILVQELKSKDHVVAMTGDGVNDVLALREADCSIAMAEGDGATRQIANIVLLDSNFTSLPDVLFEGRRVVNNVTKVSSIFFIKTIYSFILSILCAISAVAFPFVPIQITLIDLAIEGYPSFFLSFEGDKSKIKGKFLNTALKNALPNALLVVANIVFVYYYSKDRFSHLDTTTLMYYLLIGISCLAVIKACLPLNPMRIFLIGTTIVGIYVAAMLFHKILHVGLLTSETAIVFISLMVINIIVRSILWWSQGKKAAKN